MITSYFPSCEFIESLLLSFNCFCASLRLIDSSLNSLLFSVNFCKFSSCLPKASFNAKAAPVKSPNPPIRATTGLDAKNVSADENSPVADVAIDAPISVSLKNLERSSLVSPNLSPNPPSPLKVLSNFAILFTGAITLSKALKNVNILLESNCDVVFDKVLNDSFNPINSSLS